MSKQAQNFRLAAPVEVSQAACRRAVSHANWSIANWSIAESEPERLLIKIGFGIFSNPARIEVRFSDDEGASIVQLNGRIMQVGPIATRKLGSYMSSLENAIRLEAKAAPSPG